jgi:hypothetical protein
LAFGRKKVVFAGNFSQLPPIGGTPLYSGDVGTQVNSSLRPQDQEAAIGIALWHQVTTVVILRENTHQTTQTKWMQTCNMEPVPRRYKVLEEKNSRKKSNDQLLFN